jgi:hypothetical protein
MLDENRHMGVAKFRRLEGGAGARRRLLLAPLAAGAVVVAPAAAGATKVNHAVRTLCRVLKISRAAYYHWSIYPLSAHARADLVLIERISAIHAGSRQPYGAPRIHAELHDRGSVHGPARPGAA